jgi:5-methylcytosine-specific restriction endonuclease McrA
MVFLFILDMVSSIFCKCVFKIGSWVVYQSYNGVYYLYNNGGKAINNNGNIQTENKKTKVDDLSPYVILTEEEYDILKNGNEKKCKIHKRNVSSLTKKMVASNQQWKCGSCSQTLDYTYEIDHHIPLFKGGSNEVSNLIALCRNCHGKKTLLENNNIR